MDLLRSAANKGFQVLQELDDGTSNSAKGPAGGLLPEASSDEAASIWNAAAGFGRQLLQEIKGEEGVRPVSDAAGNSAKPQTSNGSMNSVAPESPTEGSPRDTETDEDRHDAKAAEAVEDHKIDEDRIKDGVGDLDAQAAKQTEHEDGEEEPSMPDSSGATTDVASPAALEPCLPSMADAALADAVTTEASSKTAMVTTDDAVPGAEVHYIGDSDESSPASPRDAETHGESLPLATVASEWLEQTPEESQPACAGPMESALDTSSRQSGMTDKDLLSQLKAVEAERDRLMAVEQRLLQETKDLERELQESQERWREQIRAAEAPKEETGRMGTDQVKELKKKVSALEAERDKAAAALQRAATIEQRLLGENKDMEKELFQAQERWREQIRKAEKAAKDAQAESQKLAREASDKVKGWGSEKGRLEAAAQEWRILEQRLRGENADMERELQQAQENWKKRIVVAEQDAKDRVEECQRLQDELASQKEELDKVQGELKRAEAENSRRLEELRAAAEVEAQMRRELANMEHIRLQFEGREAELTLQIERAQAAYAEAIQEVGTMASRLHNLESETESQAGSEEMMRAELAAAQERLPELQKQLGEVRWMRDHAMQQLEESRAEAQRLREEVARLEAERVAAVEAAAELGQQAADSGAGALEAIAGGSDEVAARLAKLAAEHGEELKRVATQHRDEIDFLRKLGEEKDRRLETLICERNALRLESKEQQSSSSGARGGRPKDKAKDVDSLDLEEGLDSVSGSSGTTGAFAAFVRDGDWILRRFSRVLFVSRTMRSVFYGYLAVLHIWIWVILHHTAATRTRS